MDADHNMPKDLEVARAAERKSLWQSIRANPKVIFIAFFASYVVRNEESCR